MPVQNSTVSRSTSFYSACKLSHYRFKDAGRRHKTPGSETKDSLSLTATAVAKASAFVRFSELEIPIGLYKEVR